MVCRLKFPENFIELKIPNNTQCMCPFFVLLFYSVWYILGRGGFCSHEARMVKDPTLSNNHMLPLSLSHSFSVVDMVPALYHTR